MTKDASFKEDLVRQLAAILKETDLTEIEYEVEGCRVKVARQISVTQVTSGAPSIEPADTGRETKLATVTPLEPVPTDLALHPGAVKSPMVGNAYLASSPESEPFVKVGTKVSKGQNILIIEAMKVMNTIKSPSDGIVKQILVHNGEPVEYDQVLMVIE